MASLGYRTRAWFTLRRVIVLVAAFVGVAVLRAAKADAPPDRFVLIEAGSIVHDTKTNLKWQRTPPSTLVSRSVSDSYCAGLSLGGTGWRNPTIKELLTIVDWKATAAPVFPTAYFEGPVGDYWSSTGVYQGDGARRYVRFGTNGSSSNADSGTKYVRCVR